MKWSWRIGRVFGVDLYMHATFLLLLAYVAFLFYKQRGLLLDVLQGLAFITLLFSIVVLHELGHVLTARRFGIATRDITLLPIGGVARLERMPREPYQELLVALAGPAVNVVLAAGLFALILVAQPAALASGAGPDLLSVKGSLLMKLLVVNISLVVFNMIPAFPMDGGRVLRALLAMSMDYVRATQIAASIGQALALLLGFFGLMSGQPLLAFIALFVWMGAAQEASMVQMQAALGGIPVQQVMITSYDTLAPTDPLERAIDRIMSGFQQDFPVVQGDQIVGVLTRSDLLKALAQQGRSGLVQDVMQRDFQTAAPGEMLERALARLKECDCQSMPVTDRGKLVGLMCSENVGEFLMIQSALNGGSAA